MNDAPKILVVGSFVMDLIVSAQCLPENGETVLGTGFRTAPGGKGLNQAVQAARWGAQVTMVGCVGNDEYGKPDYFVSTPPYYHAMTQGDILAHYKAVTSSATAPVIIYNIPSTTHHMIELDTVYQLEKLPNVAGIKDSSGNFIQFSRGLLGRRSDDFAWIQGEDYLCAPAMLCGGDGVVTGLSNARVEPFVQMYRAYECGDFDQVKECQQRINVLYKIVHQFGNGIASIKAATELAGRGSRYLRQSSMNLNDEQVRMIAQLLDEYEIGAPCE